MYREITLDGRRYGIYSLRALDGVRKLPYSLRIVLENLVRYSHERSSEDEKVVKEEHIRYVLERRKGAEIPFFPERVILQDFTGIPLITDIAAMRDVAKKFGKNPLTINPVKRCDIVIDHSVQVDFHGTDDAMRMNMEMEFRRNRERYEFLKWAQRNFKNMRVIPPGSGIIHQVNLEFLAEVVMVRRVGRGRVPILFPDTVVGTDSHTTMINGIGVLGWGVGGIEAESVLLGEPSYILVPEVIGVKLIGKPKEHVNATDIVLTVTEVLRKKNVVDKFVEFFGPALRDLPAPDRATIANMAPEYGAICGFFPPDEETLRYLKLTGRDPRHLKIVEAYLRENLLFYEHDSESVEYDDVIELELSEIETSVAGPSKPHERVPLEKLKDKVVSHLGREKRSVEVEISEGTRVEISDGSVVISSITSCTNTSNPYLMLGVGLMAKKAVEKGLRVPPYVKTSMSLGSTVVKDYLEKAGLMPYLKALGFHVTGYGCMTCIGNSGPINEKIERAIKENKLFAVAVLSGNRNFEARIHPSVRGNFIMSPLLVLAFAIAGRMDINLMEEPIGYDPNGRPVFLKEIWPKKEEIERLLEIISSDMFKKRYRNVFCGTKEWQDLPSIDSATYPWDERSTYIKAPPFFENFSLEEPDDIPDIKGARILLILGDGVTTDHISPAGSINPDSPAGKYLMERNVGPEELHSYGARRGNWEVMVRGTFANVRLRNLMVDMEGGYTLYGDRVVSVFEAAEMYRKDNTPLVIVGGKEYGSGSSRDWAAKGTALLGVKVVIAESFETIHRSNLVGMGVVPLQFMGTSLRELRMSGKEVLNISFRNLTPGGYVQVEMVREDGRIQSFLTVARINTRVELEYIRHGGILPYVLRKIIGGRKGGGRRMKMP